MRSMGKLRVEVIEAWPGRIERVRLELEEGATVRTALSAAGRSAARSVADGDRVEIYRALSADPKEARRRRAKQRAR